MKLLDKNITSFVLGVLTIALAIRWVLYGLTADDFLAFFFIMALLPVKIFEEAGS